MKETPRGCKSRDHFEGQASDAPVAYVVERADERVPVCTLCLRDTDNIVEIVASFEMDGKHYLDYDLMGGLKLTAIILMVQKSIEGGTKH